MLSDFREFVCPMGVLNKMLALSSENEWPAALRLSLVAQVSYLSSRSAIVAFLGGLGSLKGIYTLQFPLLNRPLLIPSPCRSIGLLR